MDPVKARPPKAKRNSRADVNTKTKPGPSVDCEADLTVTWPETTPPLSDLSSLVLYRVLQEGLANIGTHANASRVELTFERHTDRFKMTLRDDGDGFDSAAWLRRSSVGEHFGLLSMRDRLEMAGGRFECRSGEGGTTLFVTLPTCQE